MIDNLHGRNGQEFEVLGFKVKLKPKVDGSSGNAQTVVDLVQTEALKIREAAPNLDSGQVALLVALKIAEDKIQIENEYKGNIDKLYSTACDALRLVDELTPTVN
jgi:cell division protein ZapA